MLHYRLNGLSLFGLTFGDSRGNSDLVEFARRVFVDYAPCSVTLGTTNGMFPLSLAGRTLPGPFASRTGNDHTGTAGERRNFPFSVFAGRDGTFAASVALQAFHGTAACSGTRRTRLENLVLERLNIPKRRTDFCVQIVCVDGDETGTNRLHNELSDWIRSAFSHLHQVRQLLFCGCRSIGKRFHRLQFLFESTQLLLKVCFRGVVAGFGTACREQQCGRQDQWRERFDCHGGGLVPFVDEKKPLGTKRRPLR